MALVVQLPSLIFVFKFCCFASICNTSIICICQTIYDTRSYLCWYA